MIKVAVAGPRGKMGKEAVKMITGQSHFQLVAAVDRENEGLQLKDLEGFPDSDAPIYTDIDKCFAEIDVDVLVDFTHPEAGKRHVEKALAHGVRTVVGTSGFSEDDVANFRLMAEDKQLGAIIAPNFAIGAVLMMKFSQMAARYFPHVEIIEQHHDQKRDAPSGTAIKTAELIHNNREALQQGHPEEKELLEGARGAHYHGFRIHSVRLPGLIAHQQVIFGSDGELLTLRHDSMNRESFMHGVRYAIETVMRLDTLVYGLENILE
ncbi:4-hydroxy-tetrahydrodipicolinate reductase [Pullulanibacillus pueri]|nr:4-hydroxy-tetrahydrodipicolinate reductase [Pullulanibacillus pueri]